jgi:ketosteroid isomerase-like protein
MRKAAAPRTKPPPVAEPLIRRMFAIIDARRWAALPEVFAPECVYRRPGYPPLRGIDATVRFYQHVRDVEAGRHEIDRLIALGDDACVAGRFTGRRRNGAPVSLEFADLITIAGGKVGRRTTYFYTPLI